MKVIYMNPFNLFIKMDITVNLTIYSKNGEVFNRMDSYIFVIFFFRYFTFIFCLYFFDFVFANQKVYLNIALPKKAFLKIHIIYNLLKKFISNFFIDR